MPSVGNVYVDVLPNASGFSDRVRSDVLPAAETIGQQIGKVFADRIAAGIRDGLGNGFRGGRDTAARGGAESGGAFADAFKAKVSAALRALPKVDITADSSEADRKIAELRAQLQELSDKRVGVDIDATEARAKLDEIKIALAEVGAKSASVQVRVDTARAAAELAAFQAEVDRVDGEEPTVTPKVDPSQATQGLNGLVAAAVGLGPALIPIAAAAVVALDSVAAAATAAGAAVGVAFLALKPVIGAVQALGAQQSAANPAQVAQQARAQANAIASANSTVQSSEASLANARASAASGAVNAARAVSDAQRTAAQSVVTAEAGVTSAEQTLASAQLQARTAQQALTDARKAAAQQLQDYQTQLADGALAQRAATLAIDQAKQNLDSTNAGASSTTLQKQQAQLAYDQAVQQQKDLVIQQARLKDSATAAAKAGVDGSKQVVQAQQGVAAANQGVANGQSALAKAQAAVVEAQRKGAEQVATAQKAQADQARTSAASVQAAQASVVNAQRGLATAYAQTGTAGVSAANTVAQAFAKLTPAGAEFARFLFGLRNQFAGLSDAAQNGLLPGLQTFIQSLLPYLPGLTAFVGKLAKVMGDLFVSASEALTGPFFKQFFAFLDRETPKWLVTFSTTLGYIAVGLAGLFQALAPVSDILNGAILRGTQAFADWATSLGSNKSFQTFLEYLKASLPQVGAFFGALFEAAGKILQALAPLGPVILALVTDVLKFIAAMSPTDILLIVVAAEALWVAMALGPPILALIQTFMAALAVEGATLGSAFLAVISPIVLVVAALVGLGILFVELYQHNLTFRKIVDDTFTAVKGFIVSAWENAIKPALMALWSFLQTQIFPTVLMLWHEVVLPAFTQIGQIIATVWKGIIYPALQALWSFITVVLAPVITWLLNNVVDPYFKLIGATIVFVWQKVISPALTGLNSAIGGLGGVFQGALTGIKTIWGGLGAVIQGPIQAVLRFIQDYFISPINSMLGALNLSVKIPNIAGPAGASPANASSVVSHYATGGWTGPGGKYQPAGIVHADEFVVRKESQNSISRAFPGLLDYMNAHGTLPGHDAGGLVGAIGSAASSVGSAARSVGGAIVNGAEFAAKVISDPGGAIRDFVANILKQLSSSPFAQAAGGAVSKVGDSLIAKITGAFAQQSQQASSGALVQGVPGSASAASAVQYALSQITAGTGGWLDRCLAFVNAAWGHKVGWLGAPRAIDAWNAAPGKHPGDVNPPAGAALFYTTGNPAGHVDLSLGGNSIASTDLPAKGRVGLDNFNDPMTKWGAHYLGWALPGFADGGRVGSGFTKPLLFDSGGRLPVGTSLVQNNTGGPEDLVRADRIPQGGSPVNFYGNVGWDPDEVASRIEMKRADKMALYRAGVAVA